MLFPEFRIELFLPVLQGALIRQILDPFGGFYQRCIFHGVGLRCGYYHNKQRMEASIIKSITM